MVTSIGAGNPHATQALTRSGGGNNRTTAEAPSTTSAPAGDTFEASGVLRNLVDGHYNGVADLRLRMVHADRIAEMQAAADAQQAAATGQALASDVDSVLDTFVESSATGDETADAATLSAVDEFQAAIGEEGFDLAAALAKLEEALRAALTPVETTDVVEAPVVEEVVPPGEPVEAGEVTAVEAVDGATEPVPADPIAGLIAALSQLFESAESSETADSVLPPLAEYSGNGAAYARFLDAYLATTAEPAADAAGPQPESIDLAA